MRNASTNFGREPIAYELSVANDLCNPLEQSSLFLNPANRHIVEAYLSSHPELNINDNPCNSCWLSSPNNKSQASVGVVHELNDDPFMLIETLRQLDSGDKVKQLEVILGVNAEAQGWALNNDIGDNLNKFSILTGLLRTTQPKSFPRLAVYAFLTHLEGRTMNKVWNNVMQTAVASSIIGYRNADYPIIRLDSDSTGLGDEAIPKMIDAIRSNKAHLIKLPVSFQASSPSRPFGRRPAPEYLNPIERMAYMVTHIYALTKDIIDAQLRATEQRTYDEETGSGAQLINWMRIMTCQRGEDPLQRSDEGENKAFLRIAKLALDRETPLILYLDRETSLHHTSHRRIFLQALRIPAWQIPLSEDGADYQLYTQMRDTKSASPESGIQSLEDVISMVGVIILRQEKMSGRTIHLPQSQQDRLAGLMNDLPFHHKERPVDSYVDWLGEARRLGAVRLGG